MQVEGFFESVTSTVTYLIYDEATRDALIVDPVLDYDPVAVAVSTASVDRVLARVEQLGLTVRLALDTHAHADHLSGLQPVQRRTGCPIGIGSGITQIQRTLSAILGTEDEVVVDGSDWDVLLDDGQEVDAGSLRVRAIHTPGHTPACVCYLVGDALFTGDAMFMPDFGTGRCDFPDGSAATLFDSAQRLYALPGATRVFVGHDYGPGGRAVAWETTIEAARTQNIQLRPDTSKEEFVAWRASRDATLSLPKLLYPSVQVNIRAGRLPEADAQGRIFFKAPLQLPADLG